MVFPHSYFTRSLKGGFENPQPFTIKHQIRKNGFSFLLPNPASLDGAQGPNPAPCSPIPASACEVGELPFCLAFFPVPAPGWCGGSVGRCRCSSLLWGGLPRRPTAAAQLGTHAEVLASGMFPIPALVAKQSSPQPATPAGCTSRLR